MKAKKLLGTSTIYYEWRHPISQQLVRRLSYSLPNVLQADHSLLVERLKQHFQHCAVETAQANETACPTLWLGAAWKGPVP